MPLGTRRALWDVVDRGRAGTLAAVSGAIALLLVGAVFCAALFAVIPWVAVEYPRAKAAARETYELERTIRVKELPDESNPVAKGWPSIAELKPQLASAETRRWTPTPFAPFLAFAFIIVAVSFLVSVMRGDPDLRKRLVAVPLNSSDHPRTFRALAEIAIAAGEPFPPRPFVFEAESVNAAIVGTRATPSFVVLVTTRFLELSAAEQRAAFANLLSRGPSVRGWVLRASARFSVPFWWVAARDLTLGSRGFVGRPGRQTYGERMAMVFGPAMMVFLVSSAATAGYALLPYVTGQKAPGLQSDAVLGVTVLACLFCLPVALLAVKALSFAQEATAMLADNEGLLLSKEPAATFTGLAYATRFGTQVAHAEAYGHLFWCSPLGTSYLGWKGQSVRERRLEEQAGVDGVGLVDSLPEDNVPAFRPVAHGEFPKLDAALARYRALSPYWVTSPPQILCMIHARPWGAVDACLRTGVVPGIGGTEMVFTEAMLGDFTEDELLAVIAHLANRTARRDPDRAAVEQTGDPAALLRALVRAQAAPAEWPTQGFQSLFAFSDETQSMPLVPAPRRVEALSDAVPWSAAVIDEEIVPKTRPAAPASRWKRARNLLLFVPLLVVLAYPSVLLMQARQMTADRNYDPYPRVDHSAVTVPLPPGATTVSVEAPYPSYATSVFRVSLPVSAVSEYYNTALFEEILKSQGYSQFVNGWEGFDDPPTSPGQTKWPLVRHSGVGDGSLDSLDISAESAPGGGTTIIVYASRWMDDGSPVTVTGVIKEY
ncbi:MAG: hypothetical protein U1E26_11325 [Coriobacteriia bacterium]|nr:hypothetical protein [Coriobacteriia bacterium]